MGKRDFQQLNEYLERYPELRKRVDVGSVRGFRLFAGGLLIELESGRQVRVYPKKNTQGRRDGVQSFLQRLLKSGFPGWQIGRFLTGTDRLRHQTASFLRVILEKVGVRVPVIVVYPEEVGDLTNRVLTAAVLWWHRLARGSRGSRGSSRIVLLLPESWSERLLLMLPKFRIRFECYKYQPGQPRSLRQIYPRPVASSEIRAPYVMFDYAGQAPGPLVEVAGLHPELDLTYRQNRWELGYRGLRVFWYEAEKGEFLFDLQRPTIWRARSEELEKHIREVLRLRKFPPPQPDSFYYRIDPEQWLESLILRNHRAVNPDFGDRIYSQVPTCLDGERKILDLLTATRQGRLAVIELKVEKDLNLVFQGLDYWERVEHHLRQGDFESAGYFGGETLSGETPLLYLISPLFEYHRVIPVLRRYLKTEVSLTCIGVNSNWREGVKVLRRFKF